MHKHHLVQKNVLNDTNILTKIHLYSTIKMNKRWRDERTLQYRLYKRRNRWVTY